MKTEVILKWDVISEAWWPNSLFNFYIGEDNLYMRSKSRWKKTSPESMVQQWAKDQDRVFLCVSQKKNSHFYLCFSNL